MCKCKKDSCSSCAARDIDILSTGNTLSSYGSILNGPCPTDCPCSKRKCHPKHHPKPTRDTSSRQHHHKSSKKSNSPAASSSAANSGKTARVSSAQQSSSGRTHQSTSSTAPSYSEKSLSSAAIQQSGESSQNAQTVEKSGKAALTHKKSGKSHSRSSCTQHVANQKASARKPAPPKSASEQKMASGSSTSCHKCSRKEISKESANKTSKGSKSKSKSKRDPAETASSTKPTSKSAWLKSSDQDALRQDFLAAINRERQALELPPLALSKVLNKHAAKHNYDQAFVINGMSHAGSDGARVRERLSRAGYSATWIADVVAHGQSTVDALVQSIMESPIHSKKIVNEKAKKTGIHGGIGKDDCWYWTQILTSGPE